jgi:hypothetical protein
MRGAYWAASRQREHVTGRETVCLVAHERAMTKELAEPIQEAMSKAKMHVSLRTSLMQGKALKLRAYFCLRLPTTLGLKIRQPSTMSNLARKCHSKPSAILINRDDETKTNEDMSR